MLINRKEACEDISILLSEKRTSLAVLRTAIAIFTLPISVLTVLTATSQFYNPISINEISRYLKTPSKKSPVIITFDDGFKDNLNYVLPILKKYDVPATIYITTRFPEGDCEMVWFEMFDIIKKKSCMNFYFLNKKYNLDLSTLDLKINVLFSLIKVYNRLNPILQKEFMNILRSNQNPIQYKESFLS